MMWAYLDQAEYDYKRPQRGEIWQGLVLRKEPYEILLDLGVKRDALITSRDLDMLEPEEIAAINVGDEIAVYILDPEGSDDRIIASINMAKSQEDWERAEQMVASGDIVELEASTYNKGGLTVSFGQLRGFIPASHIWRLSQRTEKGDRLQRLAQLVGEPLKLKVIEVDSKRRRLILSERAAMREWRSERREALMGELSAGEIRTGTVTNITNFGAFVDLGGADGLVHVSEIAWHRVSHPRDELEIGDEVDVFVLSVDNERERISLSMKRLEPSPWQRIAQEVSVGDVIEGTVTNLTDFGAFAEIAPGVEGLIHLSELAEQHIAHPREVVHRGQRLTLRLISVDVERERIGLSLKRVPEELLRPTPEEMAEQVEAEQPDESVAAAEEPMEQPDATPSQAEQPEAPQVMAEAQEAEQPDPQSAPRRQPPAPDAPAATTLAEAIANAMERKGSHEVESIA